ncbi:MAG: hypothetical protein Q9216_007243, partial [Gyalolechia sp. 2 TL-2023]
RNLDPIFPKKNYYIKAKDAVAWTSTRYTLQSNKNQNKNPDQRDGTQAALLLLDRLEAET